MPFNKTVPQIAELNVNRRASSGSDITMSSSDSSTGVEIPWQPQMKNGILKSEAIFEEHQRSHWESSTDDSSSTPREAFLRQDSVESSDIVIEKLKSEVAALSRQAEMSELELQTLRKQIVKESKRGQDLFRELACLKEERDSLKGECEKFKAFQRTKSNLPFEAEDSKAIVEELRQELNHAKELNASLQIQLQKTQESNSELILAVKDLDEMLEQKNREISNTNLSSGSSVKDADEKSQEAGPKREWDDDNDDEEQKALEELVKEHGDTREAYLLERQIVDMRSEIEIYKRDRDELEMQMEQLALDYEIMKQENHEMAYKLEQSELQEQLKMQYECSSSYATAHELEAHIENLEHELTRRSKESADALATISELEVHVKNLEEELEKQSQAFEDDLETLMRSKVEQEQRAIRAEETLRKTRWQNGKTADRLQEEFKRLSVQMVSTFEANEKLAAKSIAEANELRLQKNRLEEMFRKASKEHESVKGGYEAKLHQLGNQVRSMANQIEEMQSKIEDRSLQREQQKKHAEETQRLLSDEILKLKDEIRICVDENKIISKEIGGKETLVHKLEQMRISITEMDLLVKQGNDERIELENRIVLVKNDAEESKKELNKIRSLVAEKEVVVENLQSELDSLQSQYTELKHSLSKEESEKDRLRKEVVLLKGDLKKREDALNKATSKTSKPVHHGSKEVANHKERIKLLEVTMLLVEFIHRLL